MEDLAARSSNPVWYKRQFDSASGYNGNNARNLKPNYFMISAFKMLEVVINDSNFNLTREFELIREFSDLNEDRIGNDVLESCEVVIGNSAENVKVSGMLIKKLRSYDGIDTVNNTKVCDQKADVVYALTCMSGEVYYFLTWFIID